MTVWAAAAPTARRLHKDGCEEQEEDFLDAPEHVHTDSEAEHQQEPGARLRPVGTY